MPKLIYALVIAAITIACACAEEQSEAPPEEEPQLIQAEVQGVLIEPESKRPVVLLTSLDGQSCLPIFVGQVEAAAIWRCLNKLDVGRPMTHDLLVSIINELGAAVSRIVVTEMKDGVYHSNIEITAGDKTLTLDSRPSDAIAVALRTGAKIYVDTKVMKEAGLKPIQPALPNDKPEKKPDEEGPPPENITEPI
ncbi:MAG TPA: bifunctional nuclease family protein [Planctomycetota bacterium]|nr:bifunctional nuclease family protein [Planctomycetota bacterium]